MEKRSMRRSIIKDENIMAEPAIDKKKVSRPKRGRNVVDVPPIIKEESPKKETTAAILKNLKEPTIVLQKLPSGYGQKREVLPEPITKPKRATRSKLSATPLAVKVPERSNENEERILPSRQSSVSTAPTVDLNASNESGDLVNQALRLNDYIRRSASRTIEDATNVIRRSVSRAPSQAASVSASVADSDTAYTRSTSRLHEDEYSDEEFANKAQHVSLESEYFDSTQSFLCRPTTIPREFGGALVQSVLLILVPLLTTYLVWTVGKTIPRLPKNNDYFKLFNNIFPTSVVFNYLYYQLSIFIMSGLLVSWKVSMPFGNNAMEWSFNALPLAVCSNLAFAALAYYDKFNVVDFVLKHEWRLCVIGLVHAFVTAFWLHVRAVYAPTLKEQVNVYGKTGNIITDFALGRLINPKAFNIINYKQYAYRAQLITTLLLAECYLIKHITWPNVADLPTDLWPLMQVFVKLLNVESGVFCAGSMLLLYVLDSIVYERHLASSFELQLEGLGCLTLLRYAAMPYLLSGFVRYSYKQNVLLNCQWAFYGALTVFAIGWSIKRLSSAIKYKYRLNPSQPIFDNVDSIHTYQGRRILLGDFWGRVRQPNYAGDILALVALCLPFVLHNIWQAHLGILLIIITLVHRALRVNERNHERYYSSWVRYCNQVRYYIVPKIF